ncbi:hypothetical protein Tco_0163183 [Tanacetum coccineum]
MDWLAKYQAVIVCAEKIARIPWGNETLIIHDDGSNQGNATRLNIISCTKAQKYMEKGFPIFLTRITAKEVEYKSEKKRLEDVTDICKRTKTKQKEQNRARDWKESKKPKPKAYLSLKGQPAEALHPTCIDWWMDVAHDPRAPNDYLGIGQD